MAKAKQLQKFFDKMCDGKISKEQYDFIRTNLKATSAKKTPKRKA